MNKMMMALLGVVGVATLATVALLVALFTGMITPAGMEAADNGSQEEPQGEPQYFSFDDPLTANVSGEGGSGFIQADIHLMVHGEEMLGRLSDHEPLIRDRLLGVLSDVDMDQATSTEGKEALRREWRDMLNETLEEQGVDGRVEEVYITEFVMQ